MPILTREMARAANDLPVERVDVPEWGEDVFVMARGMSGKERDLFEGWVAKNRSGKMVEIDLTNLRGKLVVLCAVDEEGRRVFGDGDAEWLGEKSAEALDRIATVIMRLSGLSAGDLEVMIKN